MYSTSEINDLLGVKDSDTPQEEVTTQILVGKGVQLACTGCHRVGMPFYYLKRSNGKYDLLCFDNGRGCWETSGRSLCSYTDRDEAQCQDLAEFNVVYGNDTELLRRAVCSRHIPAVLGGASAYQLFPIGID
jgi:hypothetical protein